MIWPFTDALYFSPEFLSDGLVRSFPVLLWLEKKLQELPSMTKEYSQYDMWLKTPLMYNSHIFLCYWGCPIQQDSRRSNTSPYIVKSFCIPAFGSKDVSWWSCRMHAISMLPFKFKMFQVCSTKTGSTTVIGAIFWGVIGWCSAAIITASWRAIALPYPCHPHMVY